MRHQPLLQLLALAVSVASVVEAASANDNARGSLAAAIEVSISRPENNELVPVVHDLDVKVSVSDVIYEHGRALTLVNVTATCLDNSRTARRAANLTLKGTKGPYSTLLPAKIPADLLQHCSGHHLTIVANYSIYWTEIQVRVNSDGLSLAYVVCSTISIVCCVVLSYLYVRCASPLVEASLFLTVFVHF